MAFQLVPVEQSPMAQFTPSSAQTMRDFSGGLGGGVNKLSIKGGRFRLMQGGDERKVIPDPHLDVVLLASLPNISRQFYAEKYDANAEGKAPDCYSLDGLHPEADSPALQASACGSCPMNVKGTSQTGGRACRYLRTVVVGVVDGDKLVPYRFDINSMSLLGDSQKESQLFSFKDYIMRLASARVGQQSGLDPRAVITRLVMDTAASVPKLFFQCLGYVDAETYKSASDMSDSPEVQSLLRPIAAPRAAAPAAVAPPAAPISPPPRPAPRPAARPAPAAVATPFIPPMTTAAPAPVTGTITVNAGVAPADIEFIDDLLGK